MQLCHVHLPVGLQNGLDVKKLRQHMLQGKYLAEFPEGTREWHRLRLRNMRWLRSRLSWGRGGWLWQQLKMGGGEGRLLAVKAGCVEREEAGWLWKQAGCRQEVGDLERSTLIRKVKANRNKKVLKELG